MFVFFPCVFTATIVSPSCQEVFVVTLLYPAVNYESHRYRMIFNANNHKMSPVWNLHISCLNDNRSDKPQRIRDRGRVTGSHIHKDAVTALKQATFYAADSHIIIFHRLWYSLCWRILFSDKMTLLTVTKRQHETPATCLTANKNESRSRDFYLLWTWIFLIELLIKK